MKGGKKIDHLTRATTRRQIDLVFDTINKKHYKGKAFLGNCQFLSVMSILYVNIIMLTSVIR